MPLAAAVAASQMVPPTPPSDPRLAEGGLPLWEQRSAFSLEHFFPLCGGIQTGGKGRRRGGYKLNGANILKPNL